MTEANGKSSKEILGFQRSLAFIIGIDNYKDVSPLNTAVNDATVLANILQEQHHFEIGALLPDATGAQIKQLLEKTLPESVTAKDRIFFYFAGHGIAADGDDGPAGYIIPVDANGGDTGSFIPMQLLHQTLHNLPCQHLMLVLDCCFSGAFQWSSKFRALGSIMPKKLYKERFDRFIKEPAWQVLTSAAYDQKALDVLSGKPTGDRGKLKIAKRKQQVSWDSDKHSPFAIALFEGLAGMADRSSDGREGDGVITATELYAYVRDRIEPDTIGEKHRQTPGFFPLSKHDKGEFIFLHPQHRLNLPPIPRQSPYKGLQSFNENDRDLFYGRDRAIEELLKRVNDNPLLVVAGVSGTGKSSVIKAGVLPRLREEGYEILPVMRPGGRPMEALEKSMQGTANQLPGTSSTTGSDLKGRKIVLIIDQYEELITRCEDPEDRKRFTQAIKKMLDEAEKDHLRIIFTVRSDFEPQLDGGALADYWKAGRYTVPPFNVEEFREIIVLPADQEVLIFDPPDLVDEIIEDVIQAPGALPLLSYTLSELYEGYRSSGRQDRALKAEDYKKMGGVMGALRSKADNLYESLNPDDRNTMRKMVLRMVALEGELAGKRVQLDELVYNDEAENSRVLSIVDKLVEARLVVRGKDYIEPAHDALVRAWARVWEWIRAAGEEQLHLQSKLNNAANDALALDDKSLLWHDDPRLEILKVQMDLSENWMNAKERRFVNESIELRDRNTKRRRRITTAVIAGLSVLLIAAIYFGIDAYNQQQRTISEMIEASWKAGTYLDQADNSGAEGVRTLKDKLKLLMDLKKAQSLSPVPIFTEGPHGEDFDFQSEYFGHYNPEFLEWAKTRVVPAANNEALKFATQPFYDNYFRNMARMYFLTYQQLYHRPEVKERIKAGYLSHLAALRAGPVPEFEGLGGNSGALYFEDQLGRQIWGDPIQNVERAGQISVNNGYYYWVVSLGFWIRRSIDGTDADFYDILAELLYTYDNDWISNPPEIPLFYD